MKIKCPQCSANNELQKHCGNCGFKLLIEGVELSSSEHAASAEIDFDLNKEETESKVRFSLSKSLLNLFDALIFIVIKIKMLFVGSLHLDFIISDLLLFKRRYFYLACLSLYFFA